MYVLGGTDVLRSRQMAMAVIFWGWKHRRSARGRLIPLPSCGPHWAKYPTQAFVHPTQPWNITLQERSRHFRSSSSSQLHIGDVTTGVSVASIKCVKPTKAWPPKKMPSPAAPAMPRASHSAACAVVCVCITVSYDVPGPPVSAQRAYHLLPSARISPKL
jgi:hypothetical protein